MESIDISKLKTNGSHFAVIGFTLPIHLDLPCQDYETVMEMNEKEMVVQIVFNKGQAGYFPDLPMPITGITSRAQAYQKPIHYSSFLVHIPFRLANEHSNRDQETVWRSMGNIRRKFCIAAVNAVNNLIRTYRYETGEINIKSIALGDVLYRYDLSLWFNQNDPNDSRSDFVRTAVPTCNNNYLFIQRTDVPEEVASAIKNEVKNGCQVSLTDELLLNAYDFIEQGNHRLAVIEGEIAFESAIHIFLRDHYKSDATITTKLMDTKKGFTRLFEYPESDSALDLRSKGFFKKNKERGENYILWEKHVWEKRCDIVHGRIADISAAEAIKALEVIEEMLTLLIGRNKTKIKRYSKLTYL